MNWIALIPSLVSLLKSLSDSFGTHSPNAPKVPNILVPGAAADQAVKDLQQFLNLALGLNPPLVVDGWLGPKTDAAIEQGIAMLKAAGVGK